MASRPTEKYETVLVGLDFDTDGTVNDASVIDEGDIHYYEYIIKLKLPVKPRNAVIKEVIVK